MAAYVELTKPGITAFVTITAIAGYLMAALPAASTAAILHLALGVALSTSGALALNQYIERVPDGLMIRTRARPVPRDASRPAGPRSSAGSS